MEYSFAGLDNTDPVDYPDYAEAVGLAIREGRAERGILIFGMQFDFADYETICGATSHR
jgi:ribose 5-phosphate isomerase RpiB